MVFRVAATRLVCEPGKSNVVRDWCFISEQAAPALHFAHPEGCAALRIVLVTVPRVSRFCEHFPNGFDLDVLRDVTDRTALNRQLETCSHERFDSYGV